MTQKPSNQAAITTILLACFFITLSNLHYFRVNLDRPLFTRSKPMLPPPPGVEFLEYKNIISGEKRIGYLTNRDMSAERNDGSFLMAQFALAPVVLEPDNENHKFLLLDYTSMISARNSVYHIRSKQQYLNSFSKILLERAVE